MTSRRRLLAVLLLAVVALTASACLRVPAPDDAPPSASGTIPTPPGLTTDAPREEVPDQASCETGSLRPGPMPPVGRMPTGSAMEGIFARGRLIVGLDVGSNLFSFRDPISGDIEGFDVDIAKQIALAIFGDPNRIEYRILNSNERISALQNREVDLVVKTLSITCDRLQDIAFSTVYYEASQRILALRGSSINGIDDLANKRVCAARGTTSIARLQQRVPSVRVASVSTWADCLVVLQQGGVDAVSTDDAILAGLAAQDPYVHVVGASLGEEPYGIGVNKDQPDLVRFVNGVLDQIRADGTWYEIYTRWLSILGPLYYPPQPLYRD
ncbi:glutamate ABC transporter substrate-binding protein [Williamsia herbipolensis]|uniref:Glutamate ABC transporter substrate-binding protein n=1 Tax=Williamsia herbipolensis TaxID=1603258 RepID=A0AAU4JZM5_9NOCA|nr:glutamate ABC transporter substrate-binding protein [Williamsia herbipolensis]MCX6468373.1 glutamate ABC transporter substrate-binding protein [Mycobacteriales bacterium]